MIFFNGDLGFSRQAASARLVCSLLMFHQATGARGFRLDAIKHIDRRFLVEFVSKKCIFDHFSQLIPILDQNSPGKFGQSENVRRSRVLVGKVC
jgi:hypothetical protein